MYTHEDFKKFSKILTDTAIHMAIARAQGLINSLAKMVGSV